MEFVIVESGCPSFAAPFGAANTHISIAPIKKLTVSRNLNLLRSVCSSRQPTVSERQGKLIYGLIVLFIACRINIYGCLFGRHSRYSKIKIQDSC